MPGAKILIVEDENIVAKDIELRLKKMGHFVPASAPSAEEAIRVAGEVRPDLVLMDIMLRGDEPGTQAAGVIRERFDIPVIYLTAYADRDTLDRARVTEPFGYILKPFDERELETAIEMALYKHRMERELRAQKQWLATTLKSIGDAVITTDKDLRVIFLNAIAERLTGWSQGEALHQQLPEVLEIVDEETRKPVENPARKALAEGEPVGLSNHTVLISRSGDEIPIDDSAAPIRDDDGTITGAVLVFRDISDRKDAEAEQSRLREQLFQSQKLEAVGHLTTGVAHNFNNALNVIIGNIELALASPSDRTQACLERARTASQTASEIVDGLLTFTQKREMVKQTVEAWTLVREVAEMCRQSFDREIEILLDGSDEEHWVSGDTSQLEQAVLNLCINARDALAALEPESRRPRLSLAVDAVVVKSPHVQDADGLPHVKITVSDNGIGMDEDLQGRLFEPFFTTKAPDEHAGMGLATAFAIVQEHAGWIECKSKPNEGTSFHIYLPAVDQEPAKEPIPEEVAAKGDATVLVVDDEPMIRDTARAILEARGYRVLEAVDGEDALEVYGRDGDRIDLVLLDLSMPKMSGSRALQALLDIDPDAKVILISGYADYVDPVEGPKAFLKKPLAPSELLQGVGRVLKEG